MTHIYHGVGIGIITINPQNWLFKGDINYIWTNLKVCGLYLKVVFVYRVYESWALSSLYKSIVSSWLPTVAI